MDIETNKNNYSFVPYYYRAIYYKIFGTKEDSEKAENNLNTAIIIIK